MGKNIVKSCARQRFSVFLHGSSDAFSGILTEFDAKMFVFENCHSVPTREGETPVPYRGRVYVERANIKYLVDAG